MNLFLLLIFIFISIVNAKLSKRWSYKDGFSPSDVTDFDTKYDWKIQRYMKLPSLTGDPPHFVVMAQPYLNGNPVPCTETTEGFFKSTGMIYSFELLPAGDVVDKNGVLTDGINTYVKGYSKINPKWKAIPGEISMSNWAPNDLIKEFGTVSDNSFKSRSKPYRLLGSTFTDGQNCWDFSSTFFSWLEKYDEFDPTDIPFGVVI